MHLSEGLLRPEILIGGAVVSAAFTLYAFKTLKDDEIPKTAVLSALFFLASFIHVPIGPTSVHLVLGGIIGAMLGIRAFIAIFVALLLQGVLFGFGGLTTLGINLFNLATPTLVGYWLFMLPPTKRWHKDLLWFLIGFVPLALSAVKLLDANQKELLTLKTDDEGKASATLPAAEFDIILEAGMGHQTQTHYIAQSHTKEEAKTLPSDTPWDKMLLGLAIIVFFFGALFWIKRKPSHA